MRLLLFFLLSIFATVSSQAQTMRPLRGDTTYFHANNYIRTITLDKFDNLYAGGVFTDTSGRQYVAKWNGHEWSRLDTGTSTQMLNGIINVLKTDTSGYVYAAGTIGSGGYTRVIRWTGQQWRALSDTLGSDTLLNGQILSMIIDRQGFVYVGGYIKDTIGSYCIVKWDGHQWSKLQTTHNGPFHSYIYTMATDTMGNIYVAGAFKNASARNYVAKWDGSNWTEIGSGIPNNGFNSTIKTIAVDSRGNIYAGGDFTNAASKEYISKWNGSSWAELDSGSSDLHATRSILSITVDAADNIYAGGFSASVSKWDGHTCTKFPFASTYFLGTATFNFATVAVAVDRHHNVYQGGLFTDLGSEYVGAYLAPIPRQYLCQAAIDSSIDKPVIVWEKADKYSADSFIIYRTVTPGTLYTPMVSIHRDSLSQWIDQSALPDSMSYRYKIAVKDTAGIIDSLSPYHQTICLRRIGPGQYQATPYVIEGDSIHTGGLYTLYRDSLGTGDWSIAGSIPASQVTDSIITFYDPFYMLYPNANYKVTLTLDYSCQASRATTVVTSNILRQANSIVSVHDPYETVEIRITPNPVQDILTIFTTSSYTGKIPVHFILADVLGQILYSRQLNEASTEHDIANLPTGLYIWRLESDHDTIQSGKLVKQ